jgi:ADP-ribosylglycohydrolase
MNKAKSVEQAWRELAALRDQVRGRTGTKIALRNLDQGSSVLHSGHDNPHYFDDIACIRAISAGILANGSIESAVSRAVVDASITHSEDGVWAAQSVAALFVALLSGKTRIESVEIALSQFPAGSWGKRVIEKAIGVASGDTSSISRSLKLENECVDRIYSYGISAPETLSLLFAHLLNAQSGEDLLLSTFLHKRNLDALPALAGAVAAIAFDDPWIPESYFDAPLLLDGVCIPQLKGIDLAEISRQLASSLG